MFQSQLIGLSAGGTRRDSTHRLQNLLWDWAGWHGGHGGFIAHLLALFAKESNCYGGIAEFLLGRLRADNVQFLRVTVRANRVCIHSFIRHVPLLNR
jgi:hypothetical protein